MVAIAFFTTLGNAQDDAAPVTMGYAAQGNVEMNKTRHEEEMERAVRTARERKALKEAMAALATNAQKPSDITTAEQFLALHRPPSPAPREGDAGMSPLKTSVYVPEFETTTSRVKSSAPQTASDPMPVPPVGPADRAEGKRGLLSFLRLQKDRSVETGSDGGSFPSSAPAPPPADYTAPAAPIGGVAMAPGGGIAVPADGEGISAATVSASAAENPGFFRRLFGKEKTDGSASVFVPALSYSGAEEPSPEAVVPSPASASSDSPTERIEIPSAPAFNGTNTFRVSPVASED